MPNVLTLFVMTSSNATTMVRRQLCFGMSEERLLRRIEHNQLSKADDVRVFRALSVSGYNVP